MLSSAVSCTTTPPYRQLFSLCTQSLIAGTKDFRMLLPTAAKMRTMLLSASCPVLCDLVADKSRVLLVPLRMEQFFSSCSLRSPLGSHGVGKRAPCGTELSTLHLYISKNQHVIRNGTSYDEIEQTLNCKQPFWSTNGAPMGCFAMQHSCSSGLWFQVFQK